MSNIELYNITLRESFLFFILILSLLFLVIVFTSVIRNKDKVQFYSIIIKEDGQVSKVGIAFIFLLVLLVYQVVTETEISGYLVELLGVIFAAEIGTKYVDNKSVSKKEMLQISNQLKCIDESKKTAPAKNLDDIDFDKL